MKRLLCFFLAALIVMLEPNLELKPTRAQPGPALAALVVVVLLVGGAYVLYVYKTNSVQKLRWLVLNDDDLAGNLTPIATNQVFVGPQLTLAFPAFRVITDRQQPKGFWRITEIPAPTNGFTPQLLQVVNGNVVVCP